MNGMQKKLSAPNRKLCTDESAGEDECQLQLCQIRES